MHDLENDQVNHSNSQANGVNSRDSEVLPSCPACHGLLRPGVVWFNETLPHPVLDAIDEFLAVSATLDLMLVIGTRATVYPAAGYVEEARRLGARVAVVNIDAADLPPGGLTERDWMFVGDASEVVPLLLAGEEAETDEGGSGRE